MSGHESGQFSILTDHTLFESKMNNTNTKNQFVNISAPAGSERGGLCRGARGERPAAERGAGHQGQPAARGGPEPHGHQDCAAGQEPHRAAGRGEAVQDSEAAAEARQGGARPRQERPGTQVAGRGVARPASQLLTPVLPAPDAPGVLRRPHVRRPPHAAVDGTAVAALPGEGDQHHLQLCQDKAWVSAVD